LHILSVTIVRKLISIGAGRSLIVITKILLPIEFNDDLYKWSYWQSLDVVEVYL